MSLLSLLPRQKFRTLVLPCWQLQLFESPPPPVVCHVEFFSDLCSVALPFISARHMATAENCGSSVKAQQQPSEKNAILERQHVQRVVNAFMFYKCVQFQWGVSEHPKSRVLEFISQSTATTMSDRQRWLRIQLIRIASCVGRE